MQRQILGTKPTNLTLRNNKNVTRHTYDPVVQRQIAGQPPTKLTSRINKMEKKNDYDLSTQGQILGKRPTNLISIKIKTVNINYMLLIFFMLLLICKF